jgi:hypothetical protein
MVCEKLLLRALISEHIGRAGNCGFLSSVWRILHKHLRAKGYRLQVLQVLNPQDQNLRLQFRVDSIHRLEEDGFAEKLVFSDEETLHVCGKVNCHNVRIWGT